MAINTGIIGLGDVDQLLQEVNSELSQRSIMPTTVAAQICWERAASGGTATIGKTTIFTVPFFANRAKVRSIYEEIQGTIPTVAKFSSHVDEWAPDAELIPKYTQLTDIYGVVRDNAQIILAMSAVEMETQLADLIGLGRVLLLITTVRTSLPWIASVIPISRVCRLSATIKPALT